MKDITILRYGKRELTNRDIIELESKINVKLPSDYKRFLLLHNGGHPKQNCYPCIDDNMEGSDIDSFLAFYEGSINSLITDINIYEDRIPKGFIPIACDSGGNLVCLGIGDDKYGMIYFWEHEEEVEYGEEPTLDNMYLIANNFTDFINSLYVFDVDGSIDEFGVFRSTKYIYTYDKYSLLFSEHVKNHGSIVTDFFAKAPDEVEDYIVEEKKNCEDILLYYDSNGKRYNRLIKSSGEATDYVTDIEKKNEKS